MIKYGWIVIEPQRRKRIILEEERKDELKRFRKGVTFNLMNILLLNSCEACLLDSKVILIVVS